MSRDVAWSGEVDGDTVTAVAEFDGEPGAPRLTQITVTTNSEFGLGTKHLRAVHTGELYRLAIVTGRDD